MIEKADWRLRQEVAYLEGKCVNSTDGEEVIKHSFTFRKCIFCWEKVENNPCQWWYLPEDMSCCICEECFKDFKEMFHWKELDGWDIDWSLGGTMVSEE